ncbi:eukaryotic translation initiation factor 3 subunit C-like, partial [Zonotrichia leucophrys gambelii]|uniref:eukaryotic translation initiation factor 3 subunit C-like n=1 Tax=Zonotrichia leucophrys gambelii TaxID=257770 RepID=UPI0031407E24
RSCSECVYLVAAMLLEIPYMAAHEFDARRRMISKQFHHQLRVGERQPLLGLKMAVLDLLDVPQTMLELLECVYLVAAMLLEIPYMAAHEFDARRRMISKQFHHQLRVGERQPLLGPPESMREHVVAASKAMKTGDWRRCHRFVVNEKMNGKVWDLFPEADQVRAMLVRKIQEESLRTYLFTYSSVYDSISMETLAAMFELDLPTVHGIISKMIINEELMASLDQPTATVMMHRTEPTATQNLALQLAEKLGNLVENNERVLDQRQGAYGGYFRDQKDGGYRKGDGYLRRGGFRQERSNY